ncbi:hypothetical protein M8J76_011597 [Diaphorina citri]|nr:hypothetical protein M8J76_011597 [Diaphorina citri]
MTVISSLVVTVTTRRFQTGNENRPTGVVSGHYENFASQWRRKGGPSGLRVFYGHSGINSSSMENDLYKILAHKTT